MIQAAVEGIRVVAIDKIWEILISSLKIRPLTLNP
jgi:hypothetical protein